MNEKTSTDYIDTALENAERPPESIELLREENSRLRSIVNVLSDRNAGRAALIEVHATETIIPVAGVKLPGFVTKIVVCYPHSPEGERSMLRQILSEVKEVIAPLIEHGKAYRFATPSGED